MIGGAVVAAVIALFGGLAGWQFWANKRASKCRYSYRGVSVDLSQLSNADIAKLGDMAKCGIDTACERTRFETQGMGFKIEFIPSRTFGHGAAIVHGITYPQSRLSICGLHGTDNENASIVCHELTHQIEWAQGRGGDNHADRALWSFIDSPVDVELWKSNNRT